jgi:hypothetical protein
VAWPGAARPGKAGRGLARQAWQGVARKAVAKPGMAGLARPVEARRALARPGTASFGAGGADTWSSPRSVSPAPLFEVAT